MDAAVTDLIRRQKLSSTRSVMSVQEAKFCEQYLRHFDAVKAFRSAYVGSNAQDDTVRYKQDLSSAELVMARQRVVDYMAALSDNIASRLGFSVDDIVEEYRRMAFAKITDYVSWDEDGIRLATAQAPPPEGQPPELSPGTPEFSSRVLDSASLTEAQKAGVLEVTCVETKAGKTVKVKLFNKQVALDRLFEILVALEETRKGKGVVKVSQQQINMILVDPVKRRAVEHLAEVMFEDKVVLTAGDRLAFDRNLNEMTRKFLEAAHGEEGVARAEEARRTRKAEGGGKRRKKGDADGSETAEEEPEQRQQGARSEDGPAGREVIDITEPDRYDIDGL